MFEPGYPPCELMIWPPSSFTLHTRLIGSSRSPWHTINWPLVSCIACRGWMTSSGSVTSRSSSPRGLNSLILRTSRQVTIRLSSAFTDRPQGSSFTGRCVELPCKSSLCIHSTSGSAIYKHSKCSHEVMSVNPREFGTVRQRSKR